MKDDSVFVEIEDFETSFWEQCPQELYYMEPFCSFKKSYKDSGKIMNAIYLIHDRKSTLFKGQPDLKKRERDVNDNYLQNPDFDWGSLQDIVDAYKNASTTWLQKQVELLQEQLQQRNELINRLRYDNEEEAKLKDDMILSADAIYDKYIDLRNKAYEELRQKRYEAGYRLSPLENYAKATAELGS